jgi:hypothetical protein
MQHVGGHPFSMKIGCSGHRFWQHRANCGDMHHMCRAILYRRIPPIDEPIAAREYLPSQFNLTKPL